MSGPGRRSSAPNSTGRAHFASSYLNGAARKVANKYCPVTPKPEKEKPKGKGRPIKYTDAQVAHVRYLIEVEHWTRKQVIEKYGIPPTYIEALATYRTRLNVQPKKAEDHDAVWAPEALAECKAQKAAELQAQEERKRQRREAKRRAEAPPVTRQEQRGLTEGQIRFREYNSWLASSAIKRREYFKELREQRRQEREAAAALPESTSHP